MENSVDAPEVLTGEQLANRWQVSISWIYANHRRLKISKLKIGNSLRFPLEELLDWERKNTITYEKERNTNE